jgi:thymidylate synthase (FAD)
MTVRLIAYTQRVDESEQGNISDFIAYVARVSNPSNQNNTKTSSKLVNYLQKNKHWSPFEMASIVMEIKTTRDIAHQILRHRSFSFQEFSQRYAKATSFKLREPRLQDETNRQNSIETDDRALFQEWFKRQQMVIDLAKETYEWALDAGIAKEVARSVLPEGNTETTIYMSGTIRSWMHYCDVRCEPGVQKEHREVALECKAILEGIFKNEL